MLVGLIQAIADANEATEDDTAQDIMKDLQAQQAGMLVLSCCLV